ncbi:unnamed protein product, partial [Coregonus sp. 'balchen']
MTDRLQVQERPVNNNNNIIDHNKGLKPADAVGKCLLLIILIPPFLNYASLQREGQLLMPEGGEIIDIGLGQKMHLMCKGQGQPVVILDAPTGMSSDIWFHVQENIALLT